MDIKFRAKSLETGTWIYVIFKFQNFCNKCYIDDKIQPEQIDENTIGQFVGLIDKNGKDIYINDIVRTKYGRLCIVKWFKSPCQVGIDLKPIEAEHQYASSYDLYLSKNLEIIGNVYDNKELLNK